MSGVGVVTELPVLGWGTLGYPGVKVCPACSAQSAPAQHQGKKFLPACPSTAGTAGITWPASALASLGNIL